MRATSRRHPIITLLLAMISLVGIAACGSKKDVERAKRSLYDTDFAVVYSAVLDATRDIYPTLDDSPGAGAIHTAWHQVTYANNTDDVAQAKTLSTGGMSQGNMATTQGQAAAGQPTRLAYKKFFIRFDITVAGGRPWRVKVQGHASEWEPGAAMPSELRGPARPHWLEGRTDALILAIYKRIKGYAVPMKELPPEVKQEDTIPKTDPKAFANVPPVAAKRLATLKDASANRDYASLRAQVFDDVTWSAGADPGADTAMAMWQADPESLDGMAKTIAAGCAPEGDKKIVCPSKDKQKPGAWQLTLELRGADWKVASFVRAE